MTSRTHDLAAFTGLMLAFVIFPLPTTSLATVFVAVGSNFLGGLAPDLDEPAADIWKEVRGGSILSRVLSPLLGGHRLISHSLLGLGIAGFLSWQLLQAVNQILLVDMGIVWNSFMIGYISHLVSDGVTKEGVPLLFPLPWSFGFPPLSGLRIRTGHLVEKSLVFPGLILLNGYLVYNWLGKYLEFFQHFVTK